MIRTFTSRIGNLKKHTDDSRLVRAVYRYVTEHISEPVRTEEIAKALYLSRSYLSSSFRRQTGMTLSEYIHRVKIGRAAELLRDPEKSVAQIGDYLGYSSPFHFDRMFRKIMNVSPLAYRRKD